MKLYLNETSPFSRLVLITCIELNITDLELHWCDPWSNPTKLINNNPFCLVPTLEINNQESLFESYIICEYLMSINKNNLIHYTNCYEMNMLACGKLLMETAFRVVILERFYKAESELSNRSLNAIQRAINKIEEQLDNILFHNGITFAHLTIAVALNYILFRLKDRIILSNELTNWLMEINQRKSFQLTSVEQLIGKPDKLYY